jgi:hypothetical protein
MQHPVGHWGQNSSPGVPPSEEEAGASRTVTSTSMPSRIFTRSLPSATLEPLWRPSTRSVASEPSGTEGSRTRKVSPVASARSGLSGAGEGPSP